MIQDCGRSLRPWPSAHWRITGELHNGFQNAAGQYREVHPEGPAGWTKVTKGARSAPGRQLYRSSPSAESLHARSEEHTSELQSHSDLVCRLLLEKKKKKIIRIDGSRVEYRLNTHK